jgi:hypothetical protein
LSRWPRIGGLRVVMSWPDSQFAPPPSLPGRAKIRLAGLAGTALLLGGAAAIGVAVLAQQHAPSPAAAAAGTVGPAAPKQPSLRRSAPVSVAIPAIGVRSPLLRLGLNPDGTIQVPDLATSADPARSARPSSRVTWTARSARPSFSGSARCIRAIILT